MDGCADRDAIGSGADSARLDAGRRGSGRRRRLAATAVTVIRCHAPLRTAAVVESGADGHRYADAHHN